MICVGASHAFGGLHGTLDALRRHLRPGGRALLGDAIWEQPPSTAAQQALGARPGDFPSLAELVATFAEHGFEVGYAHVSSAEECAKDVYRMLADTDLMRSSGEPSYRFVTTGSPVEFETIGRRFLGPEMVGATQFVGGSV